MHRSRLLKFARVVGTVVAFLAFGGCFLAQPTFRSNPPSAVTVDPERLHAHVVMLSETLHPRDWTQVENLDRCADYIAGHLARAGAVVEEQVYEVQGRNYRNVIGRFGTGHDSKLIVGAHYDAHAGTPGADDNASGVAALIELAYLLGQTAPDREIELVAYTLEEPPFFRTPLMGSAVHARGVAAESNDIRGVIVLEMVGYFSDKRWSQGFPLPVLRLFYPSRGNFIAVVGRWDQGEWVKTVKAHMKGTTALPVYSLRAPAFIPGVDLSDHRNYWSHGLNAVMITDTAFYRNHAYHTPADTADRLDYHRMAQVVVALYETLHTIEDP